MRSLLATAGMALGLWAGATSTAWAQQPQPYPPPGAPPQGAPPGQPQPGAYPQPAPYPPQGGPAPYPGQAPGAQPYPGQAPPPQGGYPPGQYPPPQGGYPPGQYPPPQGGYPPGQYPPPQGGYPPGQYPPPGYGPRPMAPQLSPYRSKGEMAYLYGVSLAFGAGTGIWVDALAGINDPGVAFIAPVAFGALMPVGVYFWDANAEFERGVPAAMATGMLLGGVEGVAVSGLQWQLTGGTNGTPSQWGFTTWSTLTFLGAAGGGLGGFAFGEWFHPEPRTLAFISSGAGWGALAGATFGAGAADTWADSGNGAAVGGFALYNAGIVATGVLSEWYTPSWESLKYMWLGDILGTVATTPIYLFYLGGGQAQHGLIANSLGGLAGVAVAGALTAHMVDAPGVAGWTPPFQVGIAPSPNGGAQLSAFGQW